MISMSLWTKESIESLIDLYRENEFLYDSTLKGYHNKEKRDSALSKIALKIGISDDWVKKKIKGLRTNFAREHLKELTSRKGDAWADEIYTSNWKYYENLLFLKEHIVPRRPITQLETVVYKEEENTDDDVTISEAEYPASTVTPVTLYSKVKKTATRKRPRRVEDEHVVTEFTPEVTPIKQQSHVVTDDEHDSFGKYIASQLRSMKNKETARYAQMKIHCLLYEIMHSDHSNSKSQNTTNTAAVSHPQGLLYPGQAMKLPTLQDQN